MKTENLRTSKEMEAWKSNQHIQSTPGYAWPNVSFEIES